MAVVSMPAGAVQGTPAVEIERAELVERVMADWCWPRSAPRVLLGFELLYAWCRRLRGAR
jgi:hypothetical protein